MRNWNLTIPKCVLGWQQRPLGKFQRTVFNFFSIGISLYLSIPAAAQSRYATSDSMKSYVHWIDLYDENNQRIDPADNPRPYSPEKTCGRCHDFKTIAHGWHFNAALLPATADSAKTGDDSGTYSEASSDDRPLGENGRAGQPLFWNDSRTGTYLPLSYRGWEGSHHPADLGLSNWQIAAKLGGYLPGMSPDVSYAPVKPAEGEAVSVHDPSFSTDRSHITGPLTIDCLLCHHRPGSEYSPFVWTEQIAEQNFAYAPTAALGLGVVTGGMRRLKDDFDPQAEGAADLLPKVEYEPSKFRSDGKVFVDLVRRPTNDACYYCHTEMSSQSPLGNRWLHDQDVHLRSGMLCVDCHRNGLDHQTVRGFEHELHPSEQSVSTLSCKGCHMGQEGSDPLAGAGRLGAPKPAHRGLPPIHFEKMSCTSCHSGSALAEEVPRQIHSIAHRLGEHVKRTGDELPAIHASVMLPVDAQSHVRLKQDGAGLYTPHHVMWPSYWAVVKQGQVTALNPEQAYELLRRPLRVRRDFMEELSDVKLSLSQRREILGDDRAARQRPEQLTDSQRELLEAAEAEQRDLQVNERISAALEEIEANFPDSQAVLISGGTGIIRDADGNLAEMPAEQLGEAAEPYSWPVAHAVRPARQSLGIQGCQECHSDDSPFFFASIQPLGVVPEQQTQRLAVHQLQHVDTQRLAAWNQLFLGRANFKIFGLAALAITLLVGLSAWVVNLSGRRQTL